MEHVKRSPLFQRWLDPESGVESWLLSADIAPMQYSFYFVNPSFTNDMRFLWIYVACPPTGNSYFGRQLAVIDFAMEEVRVFPDAGFSDMSPMVDPVSGEVYWASLCDIWKRGPFFENRPEHINSLPAKIVKNRTPLRIATHLTYSADRKFVNFDAQIGNEWYVGAIPLDGGEVEIWQKFERCYNHGQFSPTDPNLQLIAQDWWHNANTGKEAESTIGCG